MLDVVAVEESMHHFAFILVHGLYYLGFVFLLNFGEKLVDHELKHIILLWQDLD